MDRPKLVDEFAALGLLRDDLPAPPPSPPPIGIVEAPGPRLSEDQMRSVLLRAAASAGDCVATLAEAMESMRGVQEALQAVADGLGAEDEPTVEIEAEPPPIPSTVALADTAKLRAPVVELAAVIATTGGEVARAPATEAGELPWVSTPAPFGVAEGFGAAAVMVPESVPLPPEDVPPPPAEEKE
jgi:hypothetical protein